MKIITNIWLYFGIFVYWIFWIGSIFLYNISICKGIIVGLIAFGIWAIIYGVLYLIERKYYG